MFTDLILEDKKRTDISLISEGDGLKTYKFSMCGHTKTYSSSMSIRSEARCNDCYENRITVAAKQLGLLYVGLCSDNVRERVFIFETCGHEKLMQPSKVLSPSTDRITCGVCQLVAFKTDAESSGYEYVGQGKNANYKKYKCLTCGATDECQPQHMRTGNAKCRNCYNIRLIAGLNKVNCDLVGVKKHGEYLVRFRGCGHEVIKNLKGVRAKKTNKCPICADSTFKERLAHIGLTPTDNVQGRNRTYVINKCGHSIVLRTDEIAKGCVTCSVCNDIEFKEKVESFGLELTSENTKSGYRIFKLPCGCVQELGMFSAKIGRWNCRNCNETHYDKESSIYLIKFSCESFEWLKLGFSKNIDSRLNHYKMRKGCHSNLIETVSFDTGHEALKEEKKLHSIYKDRRLSPETMRSYHTRNGFTECYPITLLDDLKEELSKLKESKFV